MLAVDPSPQEVLRDDSRQTAWMDPIRTSSETHQTENQKSSDILADSTPQKSGLTRHSNEIRTAEAEKSPIQIARSTPPGQ